MYDRGVHQFAEDNKGLSRLVLGKARFRQSKLGCDTFLWNGLNFSSGNMEIELIDTLNKFARLTE